MVTERMILLFFILRLCLGSTMQEPAVGKDCQAVGVTSCEKCLASGPRCAWCVEEAFTGPGRQIWERCGTVETLLQRGCPAGSLENPRSSTVLLRNHNVTFQQRDSKHKTENIIQLQPQQVVLNLRPGEAQSFDIKFKRVEDYPIDLYYLMDLSFSMEDDLLNVKKLGTDLMDEMKNITEDFRIGFGAFVDKTVMPYSSTSEWLLENPCKRQKPDKNQEVCTKAFGFHHVLGLTQNGSLFTDLVGRQRISGNLDLPEGGFDALMQAAVCDENIGWRNVTRLLVFSSDGGFHFAGDGKLGGIVRPNDGKCHLENNIYTMSEHLDYPSISHVAEKLKEKNIQIIFAVTRDVVHLYEGLKDTFPKCAVGTLSSNSHNILQLIIDAYNALTSEVIVDNSEMPIGYHIEYSTTCKDNITRTGEQGRRCSGIAIGDEVIFRVSVTAPTCTGGRPGEEQLVIIKPQGFSDEVEVLLHPLCHCSCQKDRVEDSNQCSNGSGALECGVCRCKEGRVGSFCECEAGLWDEAGMSDLCRQDNGSDVCSGRGECICGECVCHKLRRNHEHTSYGTYCQCDDFHCDKYQGLLCGGRGHCECGVCQCFPGFSGSACECPLAEEACPIRDGVVCSGRGQCVCGACICLDSRFQGLACEVCPSCPNSCSLHKDCALCHALAPGPVSGACDMECGSLNITRVTDLGYLPQEGHTSSTQRCREQNPNGCWVLFSYRPEDRNGPAYVQVALNQECPEGPDVILITALASGSVIILGLVLLLFWKLATTIHDRREFARFQKELAKARWNMGDNPIYKSAVTTIQNPKYKAQ